MVSTTSNAKVTARSGIFSGYSRGFYLVRRFIQLYKERHFKLLLCLMIDRLARWGISVISALVSLTKPHKGYLVKEILGSRMCLDLSDKGISWDLITDGIREEMGVEIIKKEVKPGDTVVDIGANIGYYVLLESRLVGDTGKIYAIEPAPSNVDLLKKNVELNGYSNVEVYLYAVGDKHGFYPLYLSEKRNRPTLKKIAGTSKEKFFTEKIDVEVVTLDDFLKHRKYPGLVRMDVEGYEYQIIRGMKNILQKGLPLKLFIEFHFHLLKEQESIEILTTLQNAGFGIADMVPDIGLRGRNRCKKLFKLMRLVEPVITKELHRIPFEHHLDLSIDDVLSNPAMLAGRMGAFHIFFKRV
jgi:FkbM family methyltransferase